MLSITFLYSMVCMCGVYCQLWEHIKFIDAHAKVFLENLICFHLYHIRAHAKYCLKESIQQAVGVR